MRNISDPPLVAQTSPVDEWVLDPPLVVQNSPVDEAVRFAKSGVYTEYMSIFANRTNEDGSPSTLRDPPLVVQNSPVDEAVRFAKSGVYTEYMSIFANRTNEVYGKFCTTSAQG